MNRIFLNPNELENRNCDKKNNKKFNFNLCKKNTINSLNDVDYFLNNFNYFFRCLKLYKIIKR